MRVLTLVAIGLFAVACSGPSRTTDTGMDAGSTTVDAGNTTDAGSTTTDAGPSCHDQCMNNGDLRCIGNSVESCDVGPDGCLVWSAPVACGDSQVCQDGQCASSCHDECSQGAFQCAGNDVQQCVSMNGCLVWVHASTCGGGQTCQSGQCVGTCQNECTTVGTFQCAGNSVQQCVNSPGGCLVWNTVSTCGTDQTCQKGQCISGCVDACPAAGTAQCVGASIQLCEKTSSGCLAWTMPAPCGPGFTCQNATCVSSCHDTCSTVGALQCSGNGFVTCQRGTDGCLAWSATTACGANQTCDTSTGQCVGSMQQQDSFGAPCSDAMQCKGGQAPWCIAATYGFPQGYCTSNCTAASDCGMTGTCVAGLATDTNNNPISICMESCASDADCRTGYFCGSNGSQNFCYPKCTSNSDCATGNTCDLSTGTCTAAMMGSYPASFPTPPQIINGGGPVLSAPKIVPIFFSNDDATLIPKFEDFYAKIGNTAYWQAGSEYGVGAATSAAPIVVNETAPTNVNDTIDSSSDIWTWLQAKISAGTVPAPDANTLYVITYPAGTTITAGGEASCSYFYGYHTEMTLAGKQVAYAVIPRCQPIQGSTVLDTVTISASHELIEAATDPYPSTNPAWYSADVSHIFWDVAGGGSEVGDMCVNDPEANFTFMDLPYAVQRFWSNSAATAGHDPCVPATPSEVFFNTVPEMNDMISYPAFNQTLTVQGVHVPVGTSKTIPLDLYSDAATSGDWTVQAYDYNQLVGMPVDLTLSLDKTTGHNGDKVNLTITPMKAGQGNTDVFMIVSTLNQTQHVWFGVVGE